MPDVSSISASEFCSIVFSLSITVSFTMSVSISDSDTTDVFSNISSSIGSGCFVSTSSHVFLSTYPSAPSVNLNVYDACPHLKLLIVRISSVSFTEIIKFDSH